MSTSLVFGASGAVGRFLVPRLLADGHEVIAISREHRQSGRESLRWLAADLLHDSGQLPHSDAIFSVGPLDAFAGWLAHTPLPGKPRVVAVGSLSVISKRDSPDIAERALAQRLAEAESQLVAAAQAKDCEWTLLRPTLIYGAGLDRSLTPIARFATRWRLFPRLAGACGLRQPVHADDLAALCASVSTSPLAAGRRYAAGGGERLSFAAMLERVRDSLPMTTLPLPIPLRGLRAVVRHAPPLRRLGAPVSRLDSDLIADNQPASAELGWTPRAFRPTVECWRTVPLP